jgi:hypothetical protein
MVWHTNLIVHHHFMDILYQTVDPLHVLGVGQESHSCPLSCQLGQILMDILQFSSNPCMLDSELDIREHGLTVPESFFWISPWYHHWKQVCRVIQQVL